VSFMCATAATVMYVLTLVSGVATADLPCVSNCACRCVSAAANIIATADLPC
jgi:hypothetical protein